MPGMGTPYEGSPHATEVRYFPIPRYKKYLVFYRPTPGGIDVLRVLHGARDIHGILGEEFAEEEDDDEEGGR
jgi:toxin ParE1/3/4